MDRKHRDKLIEFVNKDSVHFDIITSLQEEIKELQSARNHYRDVLQDIVLYHPRSEATKLAKQGLEYRTGDLTGLEKALLDQGTELLKALGFNTYTDFKKGTRTIFGERHLIFRVNDEMKSVRLFHDGYRLYAKEDGKRPYTVFEWKYGNYDWSDQVATRIMEEFGIPQLSVEMINSLYEDCKDDEG